VLGTPSCCLTDPTARHEFGRQHRRKPIDPARMRPCDVKRHTACDERAWRAMPASVAEQASRDDVVRPVASARATSDDVFSGRAQPSSLAEGQAVASSELGVA